MQRGTHGHSLCLLALSLTTILVAGCGDSDDSSASTTTVTGSAVAGAVTGAVWVLDAGGDEVANAAVTDGEFSVSLPAESLAGELDFIVTGQYADEASGEEVNLTTTHPLALRTPAGHFQAGQDGHAPVTPDSSVIRALVAEHGMPLSEANTAFENAFGYQPDLDADPFDPAATDSTAAAQRSQADQDAAFRAAVFSQLAADLGLSGDDVTALPKALARDLGDGDLDGEDGNGDEVAIGAVNFKESHGDGSLPFRLLKAHAGFAGSEHNQAGLDAPSMGLPPVTYDAEGTQKTVTTAKGRNLLVTLDTVAASPFQAGFWTARVRHRVTVVDADTQQPVDITTDPDIVGVSNHPMMYMLSGHNHTTPHAHDPDTSGKDQGQYVLDNYYVMASAMGNGMPMGVWDYVVFIKEDTDGDPATSEASTEVVFHPEVKMTMGDDVLSASASHSGDQWTNMSGQNQARPYRIWLHEVAANGGGHDLTLFVSTQNIANPAPGADPHAHSLSFPSVYATRKLQGPADADTGVRPDVTLSSVSVEVCIDDGNSNTSCDSWQALAADAKTGRYAVTGLAGLNTADDNALQVRLTVDGNVLTTAAGSVPVLEFTAP